MGATVESQLIAEVEAALEQQQTAVSEGHAAIRDTIRELHEALAELDQRQNQVSQATADLTGKAVTQLEAVREAVSRNVVPAEELEVAREKIAELERQVLSRDALEEQLATSESQRAQLQQQLEEQAEAILEAEKTQRKLRKIEQVYKEASDALQAGQAARRRVAELEATINEYKQAIQAEREKSARLESERDAAQTAAGELRNQAVALNSAEVKQSLERLAAAESEVETSRQHVTELSHELEVARHRLEQLERDTHELDEELAAQASETEKWKDAADGFHQTAADQKSELESLRARVQELIESAQSERTAREKAETQLASVSSDASEFADLNAQIVRMDVEIHQLTEKLHKTEDELARVVGGKAELAAQLANSLKDREAMRVELRAARRRPMSDFVEHEMAGAPGSDETTEDPPAELESYIPVAEPTMTPSDMLGVEAEDAKRMLGEIFLKAGIINAPQLDAALSAQKAFKPWRHLGSVLVDMGHAEEAQVAQAIALQRGVDFMELEKVKIDVESAHLITGRLAEKHQCVPVRQVDGELVLAMENPLDLIAIEDVERASDRRVRPVVATPSAIMAAIDAVYATERQRA